MIYLGLNYSLSPICTWLVQQGDLMWFRNNRHVWISCDAITQSGQGLYFTPITWHYLLVNFQYSWSQSNFLLGQLSNTALMLKKKFNPKSLTSRLARDEHYVRFKVHISIIYMYMISTETSCLPGQILLYIYKKTTSVVNVNKVNCCIWDVLQHCWDNVKSFWVNCVTFGLFSECFLTFYTGQAVQVKNLHRYISPSSFPKWRVATINNKGQKHEFIHSFSL